MKAGCKHVAIVASHAESLVNFRRPLIEHLTGLGHRVTALAPRNDRIADELRVLGVAFCEIALRRTSLNPFLDVLLLGQLVRIFRRIAPDCVLSYTAKPVIYGSLAANMARVPKVSAMITGLGFTFIEGPGVHRKVLNAISRRLYKFALRSTSIVFFQNPDDRDLFVDLRLVEAGKTRIINGSGVDTSWYSESTPPASISFLMISRLLSDKGVREYVNASRAVRARHPQVPCRLAGWIDSNPAAISAHELGSWIEAGAIEYLGAVTDVRPLLAQCAVYVLPSYREGTPRTVLEAMSTGRAVITTDAPGCRETVIHGKTGLLVAVRDVDSLVNAMELCITSTVDWRAMGAQGRQLAEKKYDAHLVSDSILSALEL